MGKTTQIGLRIDEDILKRIKTMSEHEGIDKMSWIRRALATFLAGEEMAKKDEAIEDFIHLRIDEKELKDVLNNKKIAKDIIKAREETLQTVKNRED